MPELTAWPAPPFHVLPVALQPGQLQRAAVGRAHGGVDGVGRRQVAGRVHQGLACLAAACAKGLNRHALARRARGGEVEGQPVDVCMARMALVLVNAVVLPSDRRTTCARVGPVKAHFVVRRCKLVCESA